MSASGTGGKIQKEKSLFAPLLAGLADGDECGLNFVKRPFGNHRRMNALVLFTLVEKDTIIKRIAQKASNRRKWQWLFAAFAHDANAP